MAGDGGVTAESLREKLRRELQAEHVFFMCGPLGKMPLAAVLTTRGEESATQHATLLLRAQIQSLASEVEDTSPNHCSTSFRVLIVSPLFDGKPLLQRHRLVNGCLSEELKIIHAFEQKTLTPAQWEQEKQK